MGALIYLTHLRWRSLWAVSLGAATWVCPLWWIPTPAVMPLLWGASCLALWLIAEAFCAPKATEAPKFSPLFYLLLISLAGMIAWRSANLPNTLAALLCLLCIGLAAKLSARLSLAGAVGTLAWGWLLAGLINSAIGLAQYFGQTAEPLGTAFGLLRQRNQLATLCSISLLSLHYLWLRHSARPSLVTHFSTRAFAATACLALTAALASTCSRAGLIEFITLTFLAFGYALRQRQRMLFLVILFALLSYLLWAWLLPIASGATETLFGRIASLAPVNDGSDNNQLQDGRRLLWANTVSLIHAQPWLGVGWRGLAHSLSTADLGLSERFPHQADNAHNLPLQFAAELGLPFAVLWFVLIACLVIRHPPWRSRTHEQVLAWGVLVVIGIHSLLEYPLWYAPFQISVGLSAGLLFMQTTPLVPRQDNALVSRTVYGITGISLLCFCAYAAFDYNRVRQLYLADTDRWSVYREGTFDKAKESWLFAAQVRFAKLATTPSTPENASELWLLGHEVLLFSPEPLVFQALLRAGEWLALDDPNIAIELAALQKQLKTIK